LNREEFVVKPGVVWTDRRLLLRVLGNMLKNGLEATAKGNTVAMDCRDPEKEVVFAVQNPEVMPQEVQLQVFQRSFSTKGQPGRGIGTYSIKLLAEQYLGGKGGFGVQDRVPVEGVQVQVLSSALS